MEPTSWFYALDGRQQGPVSTADLRSLAESGVVKDDTLVWHSGLAAWQPFSSVRTSIFTSAPEGMPGTLPASSTAPAATGPAWATKEEVLARDYKIEYGDRIHQSLDVLTKPRWTVLWAILIGFACIFAAGMIPFIGGIVGLIVDGPLMGGIFLVAIKKTRTGSCEIGDVFSGFSSRFGRLVGGYLLQTLLATLPVLPGMIIVVVSLASHGVFRPGAQFQPPEIFAMIGGGLIAAAIGGIGWILLYSMLIWTMPLIADKGLGPIEAMGLSWRVASKHFFSHVLLFLMTMGFGILGTLACCIGNAFTLPLSMTIYATQYEKLFGDMAPKSNL